MKIALTARLVAVVIALAPTSALAETDGSISGGNSGDENHYILECGGICQGALAGAAITPAFTGAWFDPAQSGHGLFIEILADNKIQAAWFTFNPAGTEQAWFLGVGTYADNTATITSMVQPSGGRWIPNFDPRQIVNNTWGSLTLTFGDANHGRVDFSSTLGYGSGSMNLVRLTKTAAGTASASIVEGGWVSTGKLNVARAGHTATMLRNGRVLVAGGWTGLDPGGNPINADSAELYDPDAGTWSVTGRMNIPRSGHTATILPDGRVLVAGGSPSDYTPTELAEVYDPVSGKWNPTGSLNTARQGHTATLLPTGKVLVLGGTGDYSRPNNAELYDPASGEWSRAAMPTWARKGHTATLLKSGNVLVAGGFNADFDVWEDYPPPINAESYDPVADSWRAVGAPMIFFDHTATLLADGTVITLGGEHVHVGSTEYDDPGRVERYDPIAESWSYTGRLSIYDGIATLLPEGTVLVVGTSSYDGSSDAALYDPNTGVWAQASALSARPVGRTATLLTSGDVLIAGGANFVANTPPTAVNSAELYGAARPEFIGPCFTGSWYDPAQSGHGLFVEVLPDNRMLAAWFTFNPAGTEQSWFLGVGSYGNGGVTDTATLQSVIQPTGGRWIPNFDPSRIVNNAWGTLKFTFADRDHGRVDFSSTRPGYGAGTMDLTRLTQPAGLDCPYSPWDY